MLPLPRGGAPPCLTLDSHTVALLHQLLDEGGCVVAFRDGLPTLVDGGQDDAGALECLWRRCRMVGQDETPLAMHRPFAGQRASWAEPAQRLQMAVYAYGDGEAYFILNAGDKPESAALTFDAPTTLQFLRPAKGEAFTQRTVNVRLEPGASMLLFVRRETLALPEQPHLDPYAAWRPVPTENVLRCGLCSYRIGDGPWSAEMWPHQARNELLKEEKSLDVQLRYAFEVEALPEGDVHLAIEAESYHAITVNGQPLPLTDAGWWTDRALRRFPMGGMLRTGRNEIVVSLHFSNSPEMVAWLRRAAIYEAESNILTYGRSWTRCSSWGGSARTGAATTTPSARGLRRRISARWRRTGSPISAAT